MSGSMIILITGATGFIGSRLAHALNMRGHEIVVVGRRPSPHAHRHVLADFSCSTTVADWLPKLAGVDVVVNCVGILRERGTQRFDTLHAKAPQALFRACAEAGVKRVVQLSALGADTGASRYFATKHEADETLLSLPIDGVVVQPALVFGTGGTSARLFTLLASLPIIPLPGRGEQRIQPVHVDDLVDAMVALCEGATESKRVALVGREPLTFRQFLQSIRSQLGLRSTRLIPVPMIFMRTGAAIAKLHPRSLLDPETLDMLQGGNIADPAQTTALLKRPPRAVESFILGEQVPILRQAALLSWLLPLLRISIALVWLWTAAVSFGIYPKEESLDLLARTGVPTSLQTFMLYSAAGLDLVLGIATLMFAHRAVWLVQIVLILVYTVIIVIKLPEFLLHPYAPILKNLPMLTALYMLFVLEKPRWST
jgi:uncharacterized protein YbjT (DUF2867 family)